MPIERPKILTRFTVPTGGWTWSVYVSDSGQFDTELTGANAVTVPAGDYYLSWDNQADDFLWVLANAFNVAIDGAGLTDWVGRAQGVTFWIDSDHKVHIGFTGSWFKDFADAHRDVRIDWTADDGASIGGVLGFDTSAVLDLTGVDKPVATADYQHAYGWYADDDGMLEFLGIEPGDMPDFEQSFAPSGHSKVQYLGSRFENDLEIGFIPRLKTWSANVSYATAATYPYARNVPLQCWWKEARQGTEFRVYRSNTIDTTKANDSFSSTSDTGTTVTASGESWTVDQWGGRILLIQQHTTANDESTNIPMRYSVVSNTAQVLTVSQRAEPLLQVANNTTQVCHLFDQSYTTYVVDLRKMRGFTPDEIPDIDKFKIKIPLVRFES